MEMLNTITLNLILTGIYFVIYCGECFKYNNQTRDILCSTQCRAVCMENESNCDEDGCSPPFRYWIALCEGCSGTCDRRSSDFNATLLPAVPNIYVESIQGSRIVLQWIQPFSRSKILYVLQMRKDGDPVWRTVAYEIQLTRYIKDIEDPCHGYHFRVMAVNMYGSNGFSTATYARPNQPGPVPNISFVGGAVYYSPDSDEFMAIIQWDDPENWPKSDVSLFAWNTIPSFYCERSMVNILPTFEEVNVNRTHQQHHKVLFRVNRDAYGCRYENQVRAISKCGVRGTGTNFTVDLTDCNQIKNFPCEAVSTTTVAPDNAVNISLCVLYQHPNILIRMSWEPPVEQGTFGVDHYIIRWGKVHLNPFPLNPTFINHPNVTTVPKVAREIDVPVNYNDQSSIFGFQVVPVSKNQHIADTEWGLYAYKTIKISIGSDDRQIGTVLLDESGLRVVQIQNALEVDLSLQPLTRTGLMSPTTSQIRCSDSLDYALRFGRILQMSPPVFSHHRSLHLLSNVTSLKLPLIEASEEVQYGIKIMHMTENENISDIDWDDIPMHVFHVPPTTEKSSDNSQVENIVGIVVAGVLVFCIVSGVVMWKRIKGRNKFHYLERQSAVEEINPYYHIHRGLLTGSILTPAIVADRWELPHSCVRVGRVLGHGAFGLVLKGRVSSSMIHNSNARIPKEAFVAGGNQVCVAIKVLQENVQDQYKCDFLKEISLMKDIGFHKNIVSMLGCCTLMDPICLVVEHVPHGDLLSYLQNIRRCIHQRDHNQESYVNRDVDLLSPTDLLSFARQIAVGMEFLSQKGYVHRDLAARNVLVGYNKTVKIGDFGLTRYIYNDAIYVNRKGGKLPLKWMSIEAILQLTFSVASDIWAFGVVLFEMVTLGGTPYPGINTEDILPMLRQGYRMERPDNCSKELYGVMLSCWQELPELRPSFTDLRSVLEDMLQENSDLEYLSFKINNNIHQYYTINSDEMDQDEVTSVSDGGEGMQACTSAVNTNIVEDLDTIKGRKNVPKNIENFVCDNVSELHRKRTAKSFKSGTFEEHCPFKGNNIIPEIEVKHHNDMAFTSHELYSSSEDDSVLPTTITFDAEVEKQVCQYKTDPGLFIVNTSTESDSVSVHMSGERTQKPMFGNPSSCSERQQRDSGLESGSSNDEGSLASSSPKTISSRCSHTGSFSNTEDNVFMSDDVDQSADALYEGNFTFGIHSETISQELCDICKYYNNQEKIQTIDDGSVGKRKCHVVGSLSGWGIETEREPNKKPLKTYRDFYHTEVQDWPYEDINIIDTYF